MNEMTNDLKIKSNILTMNGYGQAYALDMAMDSR